MIPATRSRQPLDRQRSGLDSVVEDHRYALGFCRHSYVRRAEFNVMIGRNSDGALTKINDLRTN